MGELPQNTTKEVMDIKEYIIEAMNNNKELQAREGYASALHNVVEQVKKKYKTDCVYEYCGDFGNIGSGVDHYIVAYIDQDGNTQEMSLRNEAN